MFFMLIISLFLHFCGASYLSPTSFCADMNPQHHINVEQLMGMWYGVEIITHNQDEQHYTINAPSCPILHISADKVYPGYNPLYNTDNYDYRYGERRPDNYDPNNDPNSNNYYYNQRKNDPKYGDELHRRYQMAKQYGRAYTTQYPRYDRYPTKYYDDYKQFPIGMKNIRVWWDENGSGTEYNLRYNVTKPGFWFSSGPNNGSELESIYKHFAGTVQVLKAVGSHIVLTFCHQLPDRQLFTVILSRENHLSQSDVRSVHSLLNRRGLNVNGVKKVCANSSERLKTSGLFMMILAFFVFFSSKL